MKSLHTTVMLGALASVALAQEVPNHRTGGALLIHCEEFVRYADGEEEVRGIDVGVCIGVVQGVRSLANNNPAYGFCAPGDAELTELIRVVHAYLDAHPEDLRDESTHLIVSALAEAFPCS